MRIRPATHADVTEITRVVVAAYTKYIARIGKPPGPMLDDYAALVASGHVHVAEGDDGGMAGLIVLIPREDHLLLDNVAVAPEAQGQGIGRILLDFAATRAQETGVSELRLYTHQLMHENIALYTRLGWTETGRATQDGYDRVFFRKPVP